MKLILSVFALITSGFLHAQQSIDSENPFNPFAGGQFPDTNGEHINAHGGGMLYQNGVYYWFGEHKGAGKMGNKAFDGVHCYRSTNLKDWVDEGIVMKVSDDPQSLIAAGCVIERPKVIYNKATKKYVMWFHHELKDQGYAAALTGVAVSDKVVGPYRYLRSFRPNAGSWPLNFTEEQQNSKEPEPERGTEEWKAWVTAGGYVRRDFEGGQMSRDMTLYVDEDGKAYHIASSEQNQTLHIRELTGDYLGFTGKYKRIFPGGRNEAPAIFFKDGVYYLITSGLTGWKPNPARSAMANNLMGEWKSLGNPSRGTEEQINTTFHSQSTYVINVDNAGEQFILMADRWRPENAIDGRYIWIKIAFEDNQPILNWDNVVRKQQE